MLRLRPSIFRAAAVLALTFAPVLLSGRASALSVDGVPLGSLRLVLERGDQVIYQPTVAGQAVGGTTNPYDYAWANGQWSGSGTAVTWSGVEGDLDPGVSGSWSITNNTAAPQTYSFSVLLPVLPVAPSSLMLGSSSITVADANFDGAASLTTFAPSPGYAGLVDLAVVPAATLFPDPFTLSVGVLGGTTSLTDDFGIPGPSVPGPAVAGSIGIQHVFTLSPGDRATLNSTFFLVAIPEPGTLALVLVGLGGLAAAGGRPRR